MKECSYCLDLCNWAGCAGAHGTFSVVSPGINGTSSGDVMREPQVLDGKALASSIEAELSKRVAAIIERTGRTPVLATILVGSDPASVTYVRMKGNACRRIGMESRRQKMPGHTTTQQLLERIDELNADPDVHGILLQHPVPSHIDERASSRRGYSTGRCRRPRTRR